MTTTKPGIEFEKLVTNIQQLFDPNTEVKHNQILTDRLNQKRQFDVVIKGTFSGHELLGVIECKDLNKKVGTPEIDAFNTKSTDVNANFKIVVSRRGFSKTAIAKAKHYGIQTFSLLPEQQGNAGFIVGSWWFAHLYSWKEVSITLNFAISDQQPLVFSAENLTINNKSVLDGFKNYLVENHQNEMVEGWREVSAIFETPQIVNLGNDDEVLCSSIHFRALRILDVRQKLVGLSGDAFFDWQTGKIKFPAGAQLVSHGVSIHDLCDWEPKNSKSDKTNEFIYLTLMANMSQLEKIDDAIDLAKL